MKRSEINSLIRDARSFLSERLFMLPPWAFWGTEEWKSNKNEASEILDNMLGWDITDFGSGDFKNKGLFLFTLRNGKMNSGGKSYAEKIMIVDENQETPMHFHWSKMEDIINRGGGNLVIEVYNSTADNGLDFVSPVHLKIDGIKRSFSAGGKITLTPGESVCFEQRIYHRFYGEPGKGKVLVGEVSMVNDDNTDNCFLEPAGRFPEIEEDVTPDHYLVSDYQKFIV